MKANTSEQLQDNFEQSLLELRSLVSQIKTTMSKRKGKAVNANTKANVSSTPTANAAAAAANGESIASPLPVCRPKDNHLMILANMHDYLGDELTVASNENVENLFPPLPISPVATSTSASSPTSPAAKVACNTSSPAPSDPMATMLSEFESLRRLLNTRADALENMIKTNSVAIAMVKEETKENANQISALKMSLDQMYT